MTVDRIWAFLKSDGGKAALGSVSILLTAVYFFANRKTKKLTYQIVARSRVLAINGGLAGKVTITFNSEPVKEVGLFQIVIRNVGRIPILAKEFERPIAFVALPGTRFLEASIVEAKPRSLLAELVVDAKVVTLTPTLLNAKDSVEIKLMIENFDGHFDLDSRIEGVELKPGHPKGAVAQTYVDLALYCTFAFYGFVAPHIKGLKIVLGFLGSAALMGLLIRYSRTLGFTAEAPNDYK